MRRNSLEILDGRLKDKRKSVLKYKKIIGMLNQEIEEIEEYKTKILSGMMVRR